MKRIFIILFFINFILLGGIESSIDNFDASINSANYNINTLLHDYIDINTYSTGPGDVLLFNMVTSSRIINLELIVSPSGTILIPIVGLIDVKDKTLSYVYDAIINKCKEKYEDANVYVELIKTRKFQVLVTGDFYGSGMFKVLATYRVSDLIESIRSINKQGSIFNSLIHKHLPDFPTNISLNKDISLIRDEVIIHVDLFNYYIKGDSDLNPILKEGDIVNIQNSDKITIVGEVNYPTRINVSDKMKYLDLINISGGYTSNANQQTIKIINHKILMQHSNKEIERITNTESKYRSDVDESYLNSRLKANYGILTLNKKKNLSEYLSLKASNGDIIIIPERIDYIEIIGGVKNPGIVKHNKTYNIDKYIKISGDFNELAKKNKIYIITQEDGLRIKVNSTYIPNRGDIIFIEEKPAFKSWERFTESIKLASTLSTMSLIFYNIWDTGNE